MTIHAHQLLALLSDEELRAEYESRGLGRGRRGASIDVGGLSVDPLRLTATWQGRTVVLTPRQTQVLYALALARWQGMKRLRSDRLLVRVWRVSDASSMASLRGVVFLLRGKLPGLIVNHRGSTNTRGYYGLDLDAQEAVA